MNPSDTQTPDLYNHSRALGNEPVYRNIHYRPGPGAFDDLLDPDEDSEGATDLPFQLASRMRSNANTLTALDPGGIIKMAVLKVFQRAVFYPTRFGNGSYPVWYGCMNSLTTIYETAFHSFKHERELGNTESPVYRTHLVFKVACSAILIDLTQERHFFPKLTDPNNYSFTQQVGRRIRMEQHPGLLSPSARQADGVNLAIFNMGCLSNPELIEQLNYEIDPQSMQITVFHEDQTQTIIDGRIWADGLVI